MATGTRPQQIAILGGGMASLAAAWELTNQADWQDRYAVTVYQQGWRLGGKGASGRNPRKADRIEEHGLHVWFGCYENAIRMLTACYDEIARPAGTPFRSYHEAFQPQDRTPLMEYVRGRWRVWPMTYPRLSVAPGASRWENIKGLLKFADESFDRWLAESQRQPPAPKRRLLSRMIPDLPEVRPEQHQLKQCRTLGESQLADPERRYRRSPFWLLDAYRTWRRRRAIARRLREFKRWADREGAAAAGALSDDVADTLRRILISIDLAITVVSGFIADMVLFFGLDHLDGEDLRAWLRRHGAREETVWSAPIRGLYDLCFAYEDGETGTGEPENPGRPNFAAGTALECALRIALTYSGAVCNEMRAGMGEAVFAPIYQTLKRRGVRFEFFHRVKHLELSANGKSVARIRIGRQVRLRDAAYDPLVSVKGLPCWPAAPRYEQIENGDALKGIDLEAPPADWKDAEEIVLEAGTGFDRVILGIPVAALEGICGELIQHSRRWRNMVRRVKTVQTQSAQLWLTRDLEGLGWTRGPVPVNAAPEPLDVWADMSRLLERESWPAERGPQSLQYLCGPLPEHRAPGPWDAREEVRRTAESWLDRYGPGVWPRSGAPTGSGGFDWTLLHDPRNRSGARRLEAQYLRANVAPSERYVLSVAGSAQYRLGADESGCDNLFLAGDWTRTTYNAGCIEAATISGIDAARAALGIARGGRGNLILRALRFIGALLARLLLLPLVRWVRG